MGLLDTLVKTESGGNWAAQNNAMGAGGKAGHFGRLQFGQARLADAMNAGVIPKGVTPQQFMADPAMQQRVEQWHFSDIDRNAQKMGLDRFIGQSVNGIPVTQDAIRAMAHLGGIGGAAKFLKTGGQYNPSDVYGTSLADYAKTHGGADMQQGGGVLSLMGGAGQDAVQEPPKSFADRTFKDKDWRQRLAIGLAGMTLNPNQALINTLGGEIKGREEAAAQAQKQAQQAQQVNKTVEWLRSNGQDQLASALETGAVDAGQVVSAAMQAMQPPAAPDQTALMQNYEYALSQGMSPEEARAWVQGGTTVNVNSEGSPTPALLGTSGLVAIPDPASPQGWRVEPAQGSPLAQDQAAAAEKSRLASEAKKTAESTIVTAAQRAREAASSPMSTGLTGAASAMIPTTQAAEVYRQVDVLKSQAKVENLTAMRQASPTGGALGSVTEKEADMLAAKSGALDPKSPNFTRDLDDYELTLLKTIHGPVAGEEIFNSTRQGGGTVQSGQRLRFDPATGEIK